LGGETWERNGDKKCHREKTCAFKRTRSQNDRPAIGRESHFKMIGGRGWKNGGRDSRRTQQDGPCYIQRPHGGDPTFIRSLPLRGTGTQSVKGRFRPPNHKRPTCSFDLAGGHGEVWEAHSEPFCPGFRIVEKDEGKLLWRTQG